jgi:hypothetical protein
MMRRPNGAYRRITAGFLPCGLLISVQLRSLRSVLLPDATHTPANVGTVNPAWRCRRITFIFLVAVFQIVYMAILVRV